MLTVKTKDGVDIFYKDWDAGSPSYSATDGLCRPMIGIRRSCSSCNMAIPIRQLMLRAGPGYPVIRAMLHDESYVGGAVSCSGHLFFDLIIMDGASQLRPEDALGAVARGTQSVIVGNPKQLP